jgi:hypothetical protein
VSDLRQRLPSPPTGTAACESCRGDRRVACEEQIGPGVVSLFDDVCRDCLGTGWALGPRPVWLVMVGHG